MKGKYTDIDHEKDKNWSKYIYAKHYWKYFDVSTTDVVKRVLRSLIPIMPGSIFGEEQKLDMYGPLWTMIWLFVAIPIWGNCSQYLKAWQNDDLDHYKSNIDSLWSLMFWLLVYFFAVPFVLHSCFRFGDGEHSSDSRYFFIASIYGYAFTPFVPGIIVHTLPSEMIKWVSLLIPAVSSLVFLTRELLVLAQKSLNQWYFKFVAAMTGLLHLFFIVMLKYSYL